MNERNLPLRRAALLFFAVSFGLALTAMALRTANLLFFFDSDLGYYIRGALLPILEWVVLGLSVVLLLTGSILLFRGKPIAYGTHTHVGVRVGAGIGALGCAFLLITDVRSGFALNALEEGVESGSGTGLLPILFGLGATVYFVLICLNVRCESARLLSGFCVILRLLNVLTGSYFDFFVPMNAPDKLMLQLGILSAMLFLVNELRATVSAPRSVLYMFFAGSATVFLGASSLPSLIATYKGILQSDNNGGNYLILLGMFVYVTLRFLFLCLSPAPSEDHNEEEPCPESVAASVDTTDSIPIVPPEKNGLDEEEKEEQ